MSQKERVPDATAAANGDPGSPDPFSAMRDMMQQAWSTPWALAGRAVEGPAQLLEEWRRGFLSFAGHNAVFKTRIQKGGRLSIPEGERDALDLEEGDLVQVIVIPIQKKKRT